jgi:aldehyde dehydrogenase (NAD+)
MEARHSDIVDWLVRESGSTHVKAELEWQFVHAVTLEAASFPHRMEGRILPLDEAGNESRAYRQPLGVIGVISPWNFPMYLSQRSIGASDGAVIVTPEYNHGIPGVLKNALDWASRPFGKSVLIDKPVLVISVSPAPLRAARAPRHR